MRKMKQIEAPDPAELSPEAAADLAAAPTMAEPVLASEKPHLRGWIHAITAPLALATGIVLFCLADSGPQRWTTAVFALSTLVLFTVSAVYHLGHWGPRTIAVLRRLDHANIFLVIAGTYTPLVALLLPRTTATILLIIVWAGAVVGILMHIFWLHAPRWVYVPVYVALGCVAVGFIPQFGETGGAAVAWLVIAGGVAYIVGAFVYGFKRPNPWPKWFGFHEIFHTCTLFGYSCHAVAIFITVLTR